MTLPAAKALHEVLADLHTLGFDAGLDPDPGSGWAPLDRYATDPDLVEAGLRLAGARSGLLTPSTMTASWLVGDIAAAISWPAVTGLLTHKTTLITGPATTYTAHPRTGRRLAARLLPPGPDRQPGTAATLATGIVAALDPVVQAVHRHTRRGRHALWGTVTDMVAAAFHRVGTHLGQPHRARQLADATISSCTRLVGGTNWHQLDWSGGTEHTRIRNVCCLWYRTPDGGLCLTPPHHRPRSPSHARRSTPSRPVKRLPEHSRNPHLMAGDARRRLCHRGATTTTVPTQRRTPATSRARSPAP